MSVATSPSSGPSAGDEARAGLDTRASCQALFIAAPGSGQGKTTVTAGLARLYRRQGLRVRVFKAGPDFLDPMILERASGRPVYQLDLWMGGADHCRALMREAAAESDRLLVEGVMGLYDGVPSSADLAILLGIPVLAVIDASAMAQTFAAIAHGLASFRPGLPFAGVLANRVSSPAHASMLEESLSADLSWAGALLREEAVALPHRHLGLVQAREIADLEARLERVVSALSRTLEAAESGETVVRLQTGDPSLYGALIEMVQPLDAAGIEVAVVPGVSSAMTAAAAAVESLTLPEITQTVILTRVEGRTPVPGRESLAALATHHCTLCLFLSINNLGKVRAALREAGWADESPVLVVYKASWPGEERVIRDTLVGIEQRCRREKISSQAMIVVGPTLGARHWSDLKRSRLYDPGFTHRFRRAVGSGREPEK